jgi:hypothetical protein
VVAERVDEEMSGTVEEVEGDIQMKGSRVVSPRIRAGSVCIDLMHVA